MGGNQKGEIMGKDSKGIKITNLSKFYTLLLLSKGPKHGYELMKEIGKELGRPASPGQIYPFMEKLMQNKFIKVFDTGTRDRKSYKLTLAGRKFVQSVIDRTGSLIDIAITPRLSVCLHCGCKVYEGGHKQKIKGKVLSFCCVHCARSYLH